MARVGSARIDENGKLSGGQAGDQTGQEVATEAWYLHAKGWTVIRAKDANVREKIAADMEAACKNDLIGYDQSTSYDLYDKTKQYGWDCSKLTVAAETDCSSLVRVCVAYATGKAVAWFSTLNEVSVLSGTGYFDILKDSKYTQSSDYLLRGDILCTNTQGHTVVVLDNGAKVSSSAQTTSKPSTSSSEGNTSLCGTGIGTATALTAMNIRTGADTSAKVITTIQKGVAVEVLEHTSSDWYKIVWPGESCGYAFTKAGNGYYSYVANATAQTITKGDKVHYTGNKQYTSAWSATPVAAKACNATVTDICTNGKHQYHVIGDNVYGWVDAPDLQKG